MFDFQATGNGGGSLRLRAGKAAAALFAGALAVAVCGEILTSRAAAQTAAPTPASKPLPTASPTPTPIPFTPAPRAGSAAKPAAPATATPAKPIAASPTPTPSPAAARGAIARGTAARGGARRGAAAAGAGARRGGARAGRRGGAAATPSPVDPAAQALIQQAYNLLAGGREDYKGHRVAAMAHVAKAAGANPPYPGVKGGETQITSDERLKQARGLLQQAATMLGKDKRPVELTHVNGAIGEINTALTIR